MIRSILWKETREHAATLVVLTLGSILLMLAAVGLLNLDSSFSRVHIVTMMGALIILLSLATSLLTGALLTGSDNEGKTRPWLDSLPGAAWKRWLTQVGFAFAAQAAMTSVWGIGWFALFWNDLEPTTPVRPLLVEAIFFVLMIISGLAWGQWGGQRAKSVFAGFGMALVGFAAAIMAYFLFQGIISFLDRSIEIRLSASDLHGGRGFLVELSTLFLAIFFGVLLPFGFVASDFYRGSVRMSLANLPLLRSLARWSWLSFRTAWGPVLALFILGVALGFILSASFLLWPIWGLLVGVVCGLSVLGPDQDGEKSFNGSMRAFRPGQFDLRAFPALVKSLLLLITPLLPMTLGILFEEIFLTRRGELSERGLALLAWEGVGSLFPFGPWLLIWWSAGFGAALWTGLFFDKWIVSLVVSAGLGALISSLWVPSLWADEFSVFWPIGTLVVFWVLSRYLYRSFCANTLAARGLSAFATMVVTLGLFIGLGLLSRFAFVPNPAAPFDFQATAKTLSNPDARLVDEVVRHLPSNYAAQIQTNELPDISNVVGSTHLDKPVRQWDAKERDFFEHRYKNIRAEYVEKWPVPQELISFFVAYNPNLSEPNFNNLTYFNYQSQVLLRLRVFHAVWQFANGNQADFAGELERVLYLSACLRHKSNSSYLNTSKYLEKYVFDAIENILAFEKPQEKTLAEMAAVLDRHKARMAKVETIAAEVGYYMSTKALDNLLFSTNPTSSYFHSDGRSGNTRLYWDLFNFVTKAPWEKERKRRLINLWYSGKVEEPYFPQRVDPRSGRTNLMANPVPYWFLNPLANGRAQAEQLFQDGESRSNTEMDLARIAIAAKRYQLANKAFPKSLADLAPKYLAEIPRDSFTHAEFRFRIAPPAKATDAPKPGAEEKKKPSAENAAASTPSAGDAAASGTSAGSSAALGSSASEDAGPAGPGMAMGGMGMPGTGMEALVPDELSIVRGRELIVIKPGTFVLWSIGPDGSDHGGIHDGGGYRNTPGQSPDSDDMIFVVAP